MSYFTIGENDYSNICNKLSITNKANYNAQTNAAGNTVVEYINAKREIEVGIIPLTDDRLIGLLADIERFNVSISFRNPRTNQLETINTIIPSTNVDYYTIRENNVSYNQLTLRFIEL